MPRIMALTIVALAASVLSSGQTSLTARRDKALEAIKACLRRNEVSSRECKHLNQDAETLVEVYRSGDKSVLPTLFRFTYLTDFYDEALLSDPDGFLTAMTQLSQKFTYLGAFTGPKAVTLTVLPDGSGKVKMTMLHEARERVKGEQLSTVPEDRVSDFLKHLNRAHFWEMPTESQHRGFDGAE